MSGETFDVWPHDPTQIVKEALREYVGDGDGEDERVLAAHEKRVRDRIAREVCDLAARRAGQYGLDLGLYEAFGIDPTTTREGA